MNLSQDKRTQRRFLSWCHALLMASVWAGPAFAQITSGDDLSLNLRDFRSIDGQFNNIDSPEWGSIGFRGEGINLLRRAPHNQLRSDVIIQQEARDNPRRISNSLGAQGRQNIFNLRGVNDLFWLWGQFVDHDITLTPHGEGARTPIPVPRGDRWFDPRGQGRAQINFTRSNAEFGAAGREQLNTITAFIDASQVYGSDLERADALRTFDGTGRLRVSRGDLLPLDEGGLPNANEGGRGPLFLAGDVRANEHVGLTAMHTIFVREHNRIAGMLRQADRSLSGDEIYDRARIILGGIMQHITYEEFLPLLLGEKLPPYRGYRPDVNPGITNEFATAAFRFGHSMVASNLLLHDELGRPRGEGQVALREAFFNPGLFRQLRMDDLLRGLYQQRAQELDIMIVDDLRNMLFGAPGRGGLDLFSLNVQRGRDHQLAGYNEVRQAFGLAPIREFLTTGASRRGLTRDPDLASRLQAIYASPDDMDLWVAGLIEAPRNRALIGELFVRIIRDQFTRLRDGDRFFYLNVIPSGFWREYIEERSSLAQVIQRNSRVGRELSEPAMLIPSLLPPVIDNPRDDEIPGNGDQRDLDTLKRLCNRAKRGDVNPGLLRRIARLLEQFELSRCEQLDL